MNMLWAVCGTLSSPYPKQAQAWAVDAPARASNGVTWLHKSCANTHLGVLQKVLESAWGPQVPLYERIALYSVADVAVVTATRDGMNLVPYEYIVCRQGMKVPLGVPSQAQDFALLSG